MTSPLLVVAVFTTSAGMGASFFVVSTWTMMLSSFPAQHSFQRRPSLALDAECMPLYLFWILFNMKFPLNLFRPNNTSYVQSTRAVHRYSRYLYRSLQSIRSRLPVWFSNVDTIELTSSRYANTCILLSCNMASIARFRLSSASARVPGTLALVVVLILAASAQVGEAPSTSSMPPWVWMLVLLRQGKQLQMRELGTFLLLLWRKQPNKFCKWLMLAWLNVLDSSSRFANRWRTTPTENRPQSMNLSWPGHDRNSSYLDKVD